MNDESSYGETSEDGGLQAMREKVRGTNINEQTLLATDYLNHFNELVMLLEIIPEMPEILEEAKAWRPVGYQDHFRRSSFSDAALAVEAYDFVPGEHRRPFEKTVEQLNNLIQTTVERLEVDLASGNIELTRINATALSQVIQRLQDVASGIIHGSGKTMDQVEIDTLLNI
jgi:hypothetical protein